MREDLFKAINKMENVQCYILISNDGMTLSGSEVEVRAMLSQIVHVLKVHGFSEERINRAVELGLMTDEERKETLFGNITDMLNRYIKR